MALLRAGRFEWIEFQQGLVREIAEWDADPEHGSYWRCWHRAEALAARPRGYDHR